MYEFDAIFSSPAATSAFFLISAIGLSVMAAIAQFSGDGGGRRERATLTPALCLVRPRR